eukprot:TRINITY_DN10095_c0_g2_i1.p1 TRINITY_DN10095_c0_g2~~TRINITY_DN10095_c0_g2_i1.p1  ORF type:complete len:160 (+),score=15.85 TRINITY_DN10095_c0_g2_i1:123-602(+)
MSSISRSVSFGQVRSWLSSSGRWVSGIIKSFRTGVKPDEPDLVEQYVTKQMEVLRSGRVNLAFDIIAGVMSGTLLIICARILVQEERTQSSQQDILILAAAFAALLPKHCSRLEPGKAVHVSYALVMIFCIVFVQFSREIAVGPYTQAQNLACSGSPIG